MSEVHKLKAARGELRTVRADNERLSSLALILEDKAVRLMRERDAARAQAVKDVCEWLRESHVDSVLANGIERKFGRGK